MPWIPNITPDPGAPLLLLLLPTFHPPAAPAPRFFLWLLVPTPSVSSSSLHPPLPQPRCLLRSSDSLTNHYCHHHHTKPAPTAPRKVEGRAGCTISSLDPLWLYFLHSRPFPKCRPPNGAPAQPWEPLRSAGASCAAAASPLLCARSFCIAVAQAPTCFVFVFWVVLLFFFLAPFLYFLGPGEAATTDHRLVSAPAPGGGSFSSLRSSRLAPFSSVAARSSILPGLPAAGWLSPLPAASALRLSLPHPAAPSSPVLSAVPAPS